MGSGFHQLCLRYSGTLTSTAPKAIGCGKLLPFTYLAIAFSPILACLRSAVTFLYTFLNDILHMSFLAGIHVFKAFPAYTTTEL